MLKKILLDILMKLIRPDHQPEMHMDKPSSDNLFSQSKGEAFAIELITGFWVKNKAANEHHSKAMIRKVADKMLEDCRKVLASPDPRMANRQMLADSVLSCAKLQVLTILPAPAPDASGMRGKLGISGELKAHILEIVKLDKEFATFPDIEDADKAWNQVQYAYRRAWASMNIFEALRHEFEDFHPETDKDWFRPFFASQCVYAESSYREELGMPKTPDGAAYGSYRDIVLSGDKDPERTWANNHSGLMHPKTVWG